jgi:hypothetical protein
MSVLMGAIYPNQSGQTYSMAQPMSQFDPAQPTPPASYNTGSNVNSYLPQGNYVPSFPTNQDPNVTLKQDAGVFDSKPRNVIEPSSYMDKVKQYAPYIIGGAILLYYVMRKK